MDDTATPGWQGDIWLADDHRLLRSTLGRTDSHVHYAHQVLVGLGADVEVRLGERICSGPQVFIASRQPHAILSHGVPCLTVFAEPLASTWQTLPWPASKPATAQSNWQSASCTGCAGRSTRA
jgi:hypothetical protein